MLQDQLNSLLAEIDEQKTMLGEDDVTIATLRQAVARWEQGDQAGAQELQQKIKDEQDSRELSRQLSHLQQTMKLREKQMADMREELLRTQQRQQSSAASSPTAASARQATELAGNDEEIRAAQHRIAVLEREVNEQKHRSDVLQQRNDQLTTQQHKRTDDKAAGAAAERKQLTDKITQLEHSQHNNTFHHTHSPICAQPLPLRCLPVLRRVCMLPCV